ncbi:MAG: S9 family peptidase [Pseudomonadota bacterium]
MRLPIVFSLFSFFAAGALPAHAEGPMTVEDLFAVERVGSVTLSPDGKAVAYALSQMPDVVAGEENGSATAALRIAFGPADDRVYAPATMSPGNPQWRSAGTLAFLATPAEQDNAKRALHQIDVAGGAAEILFAHDQDIIDYAFANDGATLLFSALEADQTNLEERRAKGFDANIIDEGDRFARLYRVDLGAGDPVAKALDLPGHVSTFAVSRDGRRVMVALADTPLIGDDIINRKYHIVDVRNGRVENVVDTAGKIGMAAFSPDGARIAFLAGVDRHDPIAHTVAIADASSGDFEFLTAGDEADEMDFFWRDNESLHVLADRGVRSEAFFLSADGEISDRQAHEGFVVASVDGGAGGHAAVGHSPNRPPELFVAQSGGALAPWTDHNAWLDARNLGKQEVIEWTARDGVRVEGLLVTPNRRAPRGGWPMIVVVHGGPEAHYVDGWLTGYSTPGHIGAGEGYAVFYPNYRGSTGRGQEFAKLDHADPPAAEFNDVVDGVEFLANEGVADADKVGITGGSYGGYASAWGATALTEHFAAAVVFVALTDLVSFSGTTDIPEEMVDSHFRIYPEEDWDIYRDQSPIYHASKSQTPTLILHGEADPRVHPSQSLQLFRYLQRVGQAPVRLVTYPGEGHGNRKSAAQYDYALRLMRWMNHYLKGPEGAPPPPDLPEVDALVGEEE